ncbi:MAG: ABC transporter substrate-binding protein [Spirochaetia bacterium]
MKNKRIKLLIAVFLLMPLLSAAARAVSETEELTIEAGSFKGPLGVTLTGMLYPGESGVAEGDGYSVVYDFYAAPDVLIPKIISGEVEIAAMPTNLAAKLYNSGVDYRLAAVNVWGVLYVISTDRNVRGWDDLKGTTVYSIGKGTTPDLLFRYLLEENGIDPQNDLTIDYSYDQVGLSQLMTAGKVQTAVLPEPFVSKVLAGNDTSEIILDFQKEWGEVRGSDARYPQSGIVIRGDFADNNPGIVSDFLDRYNRSIQWINRNPKEAAPLVENLNIGLTAGEAEAAIPRLNLLYEDSRAAKEEVEQFLTFLLEFAPKAVGGKLPDAGFYLSGP